MLKRTFKSLIIALIPFLMLAILGVLIGTVFLNSFDAINQWQNFLHNNKLTFLYIHGLFYIGIYFLWPYFIKGIARKKQIVIDEDRIKAAMKARTYLLLLFIIFEFLFYMRS